MPSNQLLLMVQATCAPEHLEAFTLWYNNHLPNLLRIPGYLWAQRYLALDEPNRFTALYGIRGPEDLSMLLQREGPSIHPIAASEYAGWQKLEGLSQRVGNVYTQISGSPLREPLLLSDRPLSIVTADVDAEHESEWDRWYTESHVPNLLKVPGYVLAGRFRVLDYPAVARFNTGPKYLTLYECQSEEILPSLRPGNEMHPEARAELQRWQETGMPHATNFSWGFHKLISKHHKWQDG
jgi:hypothetical protein